MDRPPTTLSYALKFSACHSGAAFEVPLLGIFIKKPRKFKEAAAASSSSGHGCFSLVRFIAELQPFHLVTSYRETGYLENSDQEKDFPRDLNRGYSHPMDCYPGNWHRQ